MRPLNRHNNRLASASAMAIAMAALAALAAPASAESEWVPFREAGPAKRSRTAPGATEKEITVADMGCGKGTRCGK